MVELFFIACLRVEPTACEERILSFLESGGLVGCMVQAQPELAAWEKAHPTFTVARWTCRYPGTAASDA